MYHTLPGYRYIDSRMLLCCLHCACPPTYDYGADVSVHHYADIPYETHNTQHTTLTTHNTTRLRVLVDYEID